MSPQALAGWTGTSTRPWSSGGPWSSASSSWSAPSSVTRTRATRSAGSSRFGGRAPPSIITDAPTETARDATSGCGKDGSGRHVTVLGSKRKQSAVASSQHSHSKLPQSLRKAPPPTKTRPSWTSQQAAAVRGAGGAGALNHFILRKLKTSADDRGATSPPPRAWFAPPNTRRSGSRRRCRSATALKYRLTPRRRCNDAADT
mmetsp:Transcript_29486/g.90220  ORF Transcript_29486/g.90220 Transcript_29486/m.90220 type:complete len:202 (+) Transcript_29486:185-790(+)